MLKMNAYTLPLLLTLNLFCYAASSEETTEPRLVGLAIQSNFKVPIFYAAIYASNDEYQSYPFLPKHRIRMESRFIVNQFSARQNHEHWVNSVLVNNSKTELKKMSEAFLKFSELMKVKLFKGDHLVFDFIPEKGIDVLINNELKGTIENPDFQKVLIACWFGRRPPSKDFSQQIRELPATDLLNKYMETQPEGSGVKQNQLSQLKPVAKADQPG